MNLIIVLTLLVLIILFCTTKASIKYPALVIVMAVLIYLVLWDSGTLLREESDVMPGEPRTIKFLVWEGHFPDEIFEKLEADTGIRVERTTFRSNQEFFELIQSGESFDVAFPTDYMALRLRRLGYSLDVDYKRLPNAESISPKIARNKDFMKLFECSVPYTYGTLSIGYNRWYFDELPLSWAAFFNDDILEQIKGRVAINDGMRNTLGIILKAKGYDPNTTDPDKVREAGKHLMGIMDKALPYMGSYGNDDLLVDETIFLGMAWSSEMTGAMARNPRMRFSNADEGSVVYMQCFSILKDSTNSDAVYDFINYMYRPRISAMITNATYSATFNDAAKPYVRRDILNGPSYFFPDDDEVIIREDIVEGEEIYEEVWAEVLDHYEKKVKPLQVDELLLHH